MCVKSCNLCHSLNLLASSHSHILTDTVTRVTITVNNYSYKIILILTLLLHILWTPMIVSSISIRHTPSIGTVLMRLIHIHKILVSNPGCLKAVLVDYFHNFPLSHNENARSIRQSRVRSLPQPHLLFIITTLHSTLHKLSSCDVIF